MQQIKYQTGSFLGEIDEVTHCIENHKPTTRHNKQLKSQRVKSNIVMNRKHSTENKLDK